MPESQATVDVIQSTIEDVSVIFTGTVPAFTVEPFAGESLTLTDAHNNRVIVCTRTLGARIVLPRDATADLPDGFACTVVLDADTAEVLRVESEDMTGDLGVPARCAAYYSAPGAPRATFAPPHMPITLLKIGADRWLVSGHYVP